MDNRRAIIPTPETPSDQGFTTNRVAERFPWLGAIAGNVTGALLMHLLIGWSWWYFVAAVPLGVALQRIIWPRVGMGGARGR